MFNSKELINDYKNFVVDRNVLDLLVGFILGAGFTELVQSFANNIIMPPIGLLLGGKDFSNLYINLSDKNYETMAAAEQAGAPIIKYGLFITQLINFLILSAVVFLVLRILFKSYQEEKLKEKKSK